ncbi:MAG: fused MFS/spermidine synthase [Myxococcota bacterium]|nr:fused MFS/spermidine synthase [Myxococcota bacterium]
MSRYSSLPVFLFSLAVFTGAFLLFLVQPMVAKRILPWFGGGPGVWMVCLMFYQITLFMGYLYAHGLVRFLPRRFQLGTHACVLLLAFFLLPVLPSDLWRPDPSSDPSMGIVILLLFNVFAPFFALAATGPLLQAWFAQGYPGRSPYALYAVSNLGSFVALFLFPAVMEPFFSLHEGSELWSAGFLLAAGLIVASGAWALKSRSDFSDSGLQAEEEVERKTGLVQGVLWVLLSACAVVLLMAITNLLCLDVASIPFLWVLPLGLYLLSFIICFGSESAYRRSIWLVLALLALFFQYTLPTLLPDSSGLSDVLRSIFLQIPLMSLILFSLCMLLHGELYRLRPPASSLTSFYLAVSGGGAIGGIFVGAVAVRVFNDYHEVTTGYFMALLLLLFVFLREPRGWISLQGPRWRAVAVIVLAAFLSAYSWEASTREPPGLLHKERSFFGVVRVTDWDSRDDRDDRRVIRHGTTIHGVQLLSDEFRKVPTSYYGVVTGVGIVMGQRKAGIPFRMGVLGLGAGTMAAYGRESDYFRFYEIDPVVIDMSGEDGFFTYLEESEAEIEVVPGDARLSLQRELEMVGSQEFDLLVVDAFSSDSIPMHLLTKEALALYTQHLKPRGLLAFHVSNRFFDLEPIVYRLAAELDLSTLSIKNARAGLRRGSASWWVFLSPSSQRIHSLRVFVENRRRMLGGRADNKLIVRDSPEALYSQPPLWTDDYSSLLAILFRLR